MFSSFVHPSTSITKTSTNANATATSNLELMINDEVRFEEQQANQGLKRAVEALWTSDEVYTFDE